MTPTELRDRAQECDAKAARTRDPIVKRTYEDLAQQWRELAERTERH